MNNIIHIIVSTSCVYFFIIITLRLLGKTELAQLSMTDLIFVLLISNAVQNAMVGSDTSLGGGLIAASVLFAINISLKKLEFYFPNIKKIIEGEPILLVYNGEIQEKNCKANNISMDDLLQIIREHGIASMTEINTIILEEDGTISVVSQNVPSKPHKTTKHKKYVLDKSS